MTPSPTTRSKPRIPVAVKCLNPLNLKQVGSGGWRGSTGADAFNHTIFAHPAWGIRAAILNIHNYQRKGHCSLNQIINRWAPATDRLGSRTNQPFNDPSKYSKFVWGAMVEHFAGTEAAPGDTLMLRFSGDEITPNTPLPLFEPGNRYRLTTVGMRLIEPMLVAMIYYETNAKDLHAVGWTREFVTSIVVEGIDYFQRGLTFEKWQREQETKHTGANHT